MKDQTLISVKLSKDLLADVKTIAEKNEVSVSALIRTLLISYIQEENKLNKEI